MTVLELIVLYCLKQLNSERTIYAVYHLLKGKKSSQTIQDAHLFSLKRFFGVYELLTRSDYDDIIASMVKNNWLKDEGENKYSLTNSANKMLEASLLPQYLNGWTYHKNTKIFYERLLFFIQVTSNLVFNESNYTIVEKNPAVHLWLKTVLKEIKVSKSQLGGMVYQELITCFNESLSINPSLLVLRFTGYKQIGLTAQQASQRLGLSVHDYQVRVVDLLHYLMQKIELESGRFKLLTYLIRGFHDDAELTISTKKTWDLLQRGIVPEQIAKFRNLKLSTVEDHLVEIALHIGEFSIDPYVNKSLQDSILEASEVCATRQLKVIRDRVSDATYFQIRLVLAKFGGK